MCHTWGCRYQRSRTLARADSHPSAEYRAATRRLAPAPPLILREVIYAGDERPHIAVRETLCGCVHNTGKHHNLLILMLMPIFWQTRPSHFLYRIPIIHQPFLSHYTQLIPLPLSIFCLTNYYFIFNLINLSSARLIPTIIQIYRFFSINITKKKLFLFA